MKKVIFALLLILSVSTQAFGEIKTDTLYYDGKWKGVETPAFATYMRVMSVPDSSNFLRYRDYYITGELEGEGNYISIDKYDDSKSILDGEYTIYYKSGEIKEKGKRIDGKMDGEFTSYDTNGLILCHSYFKDGQLNGIFTEFIDNGNTCIQTEYENGVPLYDYYTVSNQNGDRGKIRLSDDKPIYESPSPDEKIEFYNDGYTWQAYRKNGIVVGMTNSTIKDYGKYYQITVVITNNSMSPIIFDTDNIEAFLAKKINKYDKKMKVLSADDYVTKVKHKQRWKMFLNEFAEGLAAASAGFSSSTTYSSFSGSAGGQRYHGSVHSTSFGYDGAAAYQAQVIASDRVASFNKALLAERETKDDGYLRKTTIFPGETFSCFLNIECKSGKSMIINVDLNGANYQFYWTPNKKARITSHEQ